MRVEKRRVTFKNDGRAIVGHLRLPDHFSEQERHPALLIVGPGSSVKEQAGATYAEKLAAKGYLTLVFDPSFQGESEVQPRDTENPAVRIEDIRCAVDFLVTLPFVAEEVIGLLGICARGGHAISAALMMAETRTAALAAGASCFVRTGGYLRYPGRRVRLQSNRGQSAFDVHRPDGRAILRLRQIRRPSALPSRFRLNLPPAAESPKSGAAFDSGPHRVATQRYGDKASPVRVLRDRADLGEMPRVQTNTNCATPARMASIGGKSPRSCCASKSTALKRTSLAPSALDAATKMRPSRSDRAFFLECRNEIATKWAKRS
ncbi:alpha/beta hydrolase [Bradyrhizobium tunisiense]|uniref:alpha/beta hydrolase n=1 Tax=Bradyrhizobium tunisiense TaxID=3278709 RepID=UPI0035DA227E